MSNLVDDIKNQLQSLLTVQLMNFINSNKLDSSIKIMSSSISLAIKEEKKKSTFISNLLLQRKDKKKEEKEIKKEEKKNEKQTKTKPSKQKEDSSSKEDKKEHTTDSEEITFNKRRSLMKLSRPGHKRVSSMSKRIERNEMTTNVNNFVDGFSEFYQSALFSDFTLYLPNNKSFKMHRIIAANGSKFLFEKIREQEKLKEGPWQVHSPFEDTENVFSLVVSFLYTSKIDVTGENAFSLLVVANQYQIQQLSNVVQLFISDNVHRENVLNVFKQVIQSRSPEQMVLEKCIYVIARNFCFIMNEDYYFIPYDYFFRILAHEKLTVLKEYDLYLSVSKYISSNPKLSLQQKRRLTSNIRISFLSFEELKILKEDENIEPDYLLEAALYQLEKLELQKGKESYFDSRSNPKFKKRKTSISFEYTNKLEFKGVLSWLATNGGSKGYENPHLSKEVEVTCSSLEKGNTHDLVSLAPSELWTNSIPASWFCVDLGPKRKFLLTHYTLRHGGRTKADALRNWDIQGSLDKNEWITLSRHTNDNSINEGFAVQSWKTNVPTHFTFRFFRVLQTGHNFSHYNFLSLSGIEFYGELFDESFL